MNEHEYIISIILRARDEASQVLSRAREELRGMAGDIERDARRSGELDRSIAQLASGMGRLRQEISRLREDLNRSSEAFRATERSADSVADSMEKVRAKSVEAGQQSEKAANNAREATDKWRRELVSMHDELRNGERSREDAAAGFKALGDEFNKIGRRQKPGTDLQAELAFLADLARRAQRDIEAEVNESGRRQSELRRRDLQERMESIREAADEDTRFVHSAELQQQQSANRRKAFLLDVVNSVMEREIQVERSVSEIHRAEEADRQRVTMSRIQAEESARVAAARAAAQAARESVTQRVVREVDTDTDTGFLGRADALGTRLQQTGIEIRALGSEMRGLLILGVIGFFQQLATAAISLGGNLLALAGSAAYAGAALGGALVAGAAQALPALGLLIGAFQSVGNVMDAFQQRQNAAQQTAVQAAANQERQANALGRVKDAQDSLVGAQQRLQNAEDAEGVALERLNDAREEAREELEEYILAERRAELALRGASLSIEEAQRDLREALLTGDQLRIQQARLSVQESRLSRDEARTNLTNVRRDAAEARRAGVEGDPQVEQARRGVEQARQGIEAARRGVEAARRNVTEAGRAAAEANAEIVTAQRNLDYLLSQMSDAERRLFEAIIRISDNYRALIRPITDVIVDSFARTVDRISEVMADPRILIGLAGISVAIADAIDQLTDAFTDDESIAQFGRIMEDSAESIEIFADIFENLGDIFFDVAESAGPALEELLRWIEGLTGELSDMAEAGRQSGELAEFFEGGIEHLQAWFELAHSVLRLFIAFSGPGGGAESGLRIIEAITAEINSWADAINRDGSGVQQFFEDAEFVLGQIWRLLEAVGIALWETFDPQAVEALVNILVEVVLPAIQTIIEAIGEFVKILEQIIGIPVVGEIVKQIAIFLAFSKAITVILGLFGTWIRLGTQILGWGDKFLAFGSRLPIIGAAFRGIATAITAVGTALGGAALTRGLGGFLGGAGGVSVGGGRTLTSGSPLGAADDAVKQGGRWGSNFLNGAKGILKASAFLTIGIGAVEGMIAGFRHGNVEAGLRDFASSVTFGLIDSTEEKLDEAFERQRRRLQANRDATEGPADRPQTGKGFVGDFNPKTQDEEDLELLRDNNEELADSIDKFDELRDKLESIRERMRRGDAFVNINAAIREIQKFAAQAPEEMQPMYQKLIEDAREAAGEIRKELRPESISFEFGVKVQKDPKQWQALVDDALKEVQKLPPRLRREGVRSLRQMAEGLRESNVLTDEQFRRLNTRVDRRMEAYREKVSKESARASRNFIENTSILLKAADIQMGGMLSTINGYLEKLGVGKVQSPRGAGRALGNAVNLVGGLIGANAVGGWVGNPGERGSDKELRLVGRGEAILNWGQQREINARLGGQDTLSTIIERTRGWHAGGWGSGGFATGRPGQADFGGHPTNVNNAIRRIVAEILGRFQGLQVTSTTDHSRLTSSGNVSDHVLGQAVDISGPVGLMNAAARWVLNSGLAQRLKQGIYSGNPQLTINQGQNVGAGFFGAGVMGQHANHLHLAMTGAVGRLAGAVGRLIGRIGRKEFEWPAGGAMREFGQAALDRVRRAGNRFLERQEGSVDDHAGGRARRVEGAMSRGEVLGVINQAMRIVRTPASLRDEWRAMAIDRAYQESSFDPNAVNDWDVNAQRGDPSRGLFQTIGATFRSYAAPGMGNILNPLHNTVAAFKYMLAQYGNGSWQAALAGMLGRRGVGYDMGGEIPGREGDPVPILAHAKEWVVNRAQQSRLARRLGTSIDNLRDFLGFSGGPTEFQGGGELDFQLDSRQRAIRRGDYRFPAIEPLDPIGVIQEIRRLNRALRNVERKSKESMEKYTTRFLREFDALTGEGGLLDDLEVAMDRARQRREARLLSRTYGRIDGTLTRTLTEDEVLAEEFGDLGAERGDLQRARRRVRRARGRAGSVQQALTSRIRRLRRGDEDEGEQEEIEALLRKRQNVVSGRRRLTEAIDSFDQRLDENLQRRYEIRVEQFEDSVEQVNRTAGRRTAALDIRERIAQAFGRVDELSGIMFERAGIISDQITELRARVERARALGLTTQAEDLEDQIAELQASITEAAANILRFSIEQINERAQRRLSRLDTAERAIGFGAVSGFMAAATGVSTRGQVFAARGQTLQDQRRELLDRLSIAQMQNNVGAMEDLTTQILELEVAIAENTEAATRARIDAINARSQFITGASGAGQGIINALGQATGIVDTQAIGALIQQSVAALQQASMGLWGELAGYLGQGFAAGRYDLSSPQGIVAFLAAVVPALQALPEEQRGTAQSIVDALLGNQQAVVDNTNQLGELTGTLVQTWSSSAWELYRQAIFTGSGGLMPNYQIPQMHGGGTVPRDGIYALAEGESVRARGFGGWNGDGDYFDIDINNSMEADPMHIAKRIVWEKSQRGRR